MAIDIENPGGDAAALTAALAASLAATFQPLDSDLTAIAALATTAYGRSLLTLANLAALVTALDPSFLTPTEGDAAYQPKDADLTTIAGLTATTDSFMQAKAGAWAARTIAQVQSDLGITAKVYFRAGKSGNQTATGAAATAITFDTENFDVGSKFASNVWTPPAGPVLLHAALKMNGTNLAASSQRLELHKNGSVMKRLDFQPLIATACEWDCTTIDVANGTDTYGVSTTIFTSSGDGTINLGTWFEGTTL